MGRKNPICSRTRPGRAISFPRLLAVVAVPAFLLAAAWLLRLAWADLEFRRGTPASVERAAALAPGYAPYWTARSDWGSPEREADLERAVRLNPYYSEAWIELGLSAEARGDLARAERCLRQAAQVDKGFLPRWTLANYYFRHRQPEEFWKWARLSLLAAPGDATALYRLSWMFEPDEELILARAIPDEPDHLARYLLFLVTERRLEAAVKVAHRLIERGAEPHVGLLVNLTEQLLMRGDSGRAVGLWNAACRRGLLPYEVLEPDGGRLVTNGDFRSPPRGAGFDWRILPVEGVVADVLPEGRGLRLRFSGRQPEHCELLAQYVPVRQGACYRLHSRSHTDDVSEESGLRWVISEAGSRRRLAVGPLGADEEHGAATAFCAAPGMELIKLTLRYDRTAGSTPLQGSVTLTLVEMGEAPAPSGATRASR
jgi:tetratricopeptide (TPR) repeat protein